MNTKLLLEYTMMAEVAMCVACLFIMWRKRLLKDMWGLAAFLGVYAMEGTLAISLLFFRAKIHEFTSEHGLSFIAAIFQQPFTWHFLFFSQWTAVLIEYVLLLIVIYGAFRLAMKPLRGLHDAGKMIFRWVGVVSLLLSIGMAFGPRPADPVDNIVGAIAGRLQQGTSVLLLCMLLFVCFATRYLGLTFRSRIFGVLLGLGIYSASSLVEAAWLATKGAANVYAPVFLVSAFGFIACLLVWNGYLIAPEQKRKLVLLPTTSPYFFWNQVSEALRDDPGNVVVSGFTPDMLAPGELQMLKKKKEPATVPAPQQEQPAKVASGQ